MRVMALDIGEKRVGVAVSDPGERVASPVVVLPANEVRARATHTVKIPMRDTQESLNAAISAGIIMYVLQKDEFNE